METRLVILPQKTLFRLNGSKFEDTRRIVRGVFLIKRRHRKIREALSEVQHIRFKRAKDIPKGDSRKLKPFEERTFAVVTYSFGGASEQQKKKMQRLLLRAPCIRVRPGVLIFPNLRSKEKARYYSNAGDILDSKKLAREAHLIGARVNRWTRLRLANREAEEYIDASFNEMLKLDLDSFEKKLKHLSQEMDDPSISQKSLRLHLNVLAAKFIKLKRKYGILKAIWQYDSQKELKRVYNRMLKTRRKYQDRNLHTESVKGR